MSGCQRLIFIGASRNFREMALIIDDLNKVEKRYELIGLLDDDESLQGQELNGVPVVGRLQEAHNFPDCRFVFGIGSFRTRLERHLILSRTGIARERFESLVHPSAVVYPAARLSPGCIVYPGATICDAAELRDFTTVTFNAVIGPNVLVEEYAMITTNVCVLAGAHIGKAAFIGANSVIGEGVRVGAAAVVVFGSTVFQDVRAGAFIQGNPARYLYSKEVPTELTSLMD